MKKIVLVLLVALMGTTMMNAQPPRGERRMQDRIAQLEKELNLNEEQKAQITEIYKEGMPQRQFDRNQMKEGEKPDQADKKSFRERFMEQQAAMDAKIAKVLTPEQREKFDQLRLEEQKREGYRGHGPKDRRHGDRHHGDQHKKAPKDGNCCKAGENKGCCDKPKTAEKPETHQGE